MTLSPPALGVRLLLFGTWRSPVAHLNGVQGVAGSNPAVPTQSVRDEAKLTADLRSAAQLIRPSRTRRPGSRTARLHEGPDNDFGLVGPFALVAARGGVMGFVF